MAQAQSHIAVSNLSVEQVAGAINGMIAERAAERLRKAPPAEPQPEAPKTTRATQAARARHRTSACPPRTTTAIPRSGSTRPQAPAALPIGLLVALPPQPGPAADDGHAGQAEGPRAAQAGAGGRGGIRQGLRRGAAAQRPSRLPRHAGGPEGQVPRPGRARVRHQGGAGEAHQGQGRPRPSSSRTSSACSASMVERDGLEVLKPDAMREVRQAAASITLNPHLARAFQGGIPEVSVFWVDEYGIPCKCRARLAQAAHHRRHQEVRQRARAAVRYRGDAGHRRVPLRHLGQALPRRLRLPLRVRRRGPRVRRLPAEARLGRAHHAARARCAGPGCSTRPRARR